MCVCVCVYVCVNSPARGMDIVCLNICVSACVLQFFLRNRLLKAMVTDHKLNPFQREKQLKASSQRSSDINDIHVQDHLLYYADATRFVAINLLPEATAGASICYSNQ